MASVCSSTELRHSVWREPKIIPQLAAALELSPPSVHTHLSDMMKSELLRESEDCERRYPTECYYELNFPVVKASERAEFEALCQEMAERVADLFEKKRLQMERVFIISTNARTGSLKPVRAN